MHQHFELIVKHLLEEMQKKPPIIGPNVDLWYGNSQKPHKWLNLFGRQGAETMSYLSTMNQTLREFPVMW